MRPHLWLGSAFLLFAMAPNLSSASPHDAIPADAEKVVNAVHVAADRRDLVALQKLMTEDFIWSFGGDGSAQQAIDEWRANPDLLAELRKATAGACERIAPDHVQCPPDAAISYRAGFSRTTAGWRLVYFVAGD